LRYFSKSEKAEQEEKEAVKTKKEVDSLNYCPLLESLRKPKRTCDRDSLRIIFGTSLLKLRKYHKANISVLKTQ